MEQRMRTIVNLALDEAKKAVESEDKYLTCNVHKAHARIDALKVKE